MSFYLSNIYLKIVSTCKASLNAEKLSQNYFCIISIKQKTEYLILFYQQIVANKQDWKYYLLIEYQCKFEAYF